MVSWVFLYTIQPKYLHNKLRKKFPCPPPFKGNVQILVSASFRIYKDLQMANSKTRDVHYIINKCLKQLYACTTESMNFYEPSGP